jgi:hypothetical protein
MLPALEILIMLRPSNRQAELPSRETLCFAPTDAGATKTCLE